MSDAVRWRSWQGVAALLVFALVIAGMLAFPMVIALKGTNARIFEVVVGGLYYLGGWCLTLILALDGLSYLYGFERPFLSSATSIWVTWASSSVRTPSGAVGTALLSFAMTLYGYAGLYIFVSHRDAAAFSCGPLGVVDAIYFTVVTAATVGYGDIHPVSPAARMLVTSEILVAFLFAVFVLSTVAALASQRR